MGSSKSIFFTREQNRLANLTKALGHPARIAILQYMMENRTCIVGALTDVLPISQSTISQHLKELKNAGIIKGEIEGPSVCYCIDEDAWNKASEDLSNFITSIGKNCC
jgi:DNA-binding transcriptional ArsR family regulator